VSNISPNLCTQLAPLLRAIHCQADKSVAKSFICSPSSLVLSRNHERTVSSLAYIQYATPFILSVTGRNMPEPPPVAPLLIEAASELSSQKPCWLY